MSVRNNLGREDNLSMGGEEKELIYLYCVTDKAPKLKEVENFADKLYFIYRQGIYAVVSKVKENEFSEENLKRNLANLDWIKEKANIHEKIIEGVMKYTRVIPFKFGTIFNTEDNLRVMLGEHSEKFKVNLTNLEGKEEWGVKIYCDMERLKGSTIKEEDEILKIDKEINSSSSGKAYFLKKKKEELIKDVLNKTINEYGQKSFETLKGLSIEARINKLLPKEVTERKDDMILNSAFLIDKNKVTEFIQATDDLKTKYNNKGLNFDCTGPWPPYNFCQFAKEKMQNG